MLVSLCGTAFAEESRVVHITDSGDLRRLAKDCILDTYSDGLTVSLDADVDLGNVPFTPVPVFNGTFEGNKHTISGFSLGTDGSHQGFFRYVGKDAVITDLTIEGKAEPEGSRSQIGGIAGVNDGQITRCSFKGSVSGLNYVGGIAGVNNGLITACTAEGSIQGKRFTGGISGYNAKDGSIMNCRNRADVNTVISEGGIDIDKLNISNALESLNLVSVQDEDIVSDAGGIAGYSQGEIATSLNYGKIGYPHYGYNIGGIAGRQSGFIHDCNNRGDVYGRNDIGGIAGQMEPYLIIKDKATIGDALSALAGSVYGTLRNLGANSDEVNAAMNDFSTNAKAASDLIVGYVDEDGKWQAGSGLNPLDPDSQELLDAAMNGMNSAMNSISGYMSQTVKGAANDLQGVNANFYSVMSLLSSAISGNLSVEIYDDVSDSVKADETEGKVLSCINDGAVDGDRNVGGITGSMAVELEFDMEGALLETFEETVDGGIEAIKYESKCLNYSNINNGTANAKKDYSGGIAGYQNVGTIVGCENYADISAGEDFAGGIAGRSNAVIRNSYAMCNLSAGEYVGGIAGYGVNIFDCGTLVRMDDATAAYGAIAGYAFDFDEKKICNDIFVSPDLGAIDGISYAGIAEGTDYAEFSSNEAVPERMKDLNITFKADGKTVAKIPFTYGGGISKSAIPEVPVKVGYSGCWPDFNSSEIYFSTVIEAVYEPNLGAVASDAVREENALPIVVLEGDFKAGTEARLEPYDGDNVPAEAIEAWKLSVVGENPGEYSLRFLKSDDVKKVYISVIQDGEWIKQSAEQLGSYLAFDASGSEVIFAVYEKGIT